MRVDRQSRRAPRHLGSRRDQRHHRAHRRALDSIPLVCITGQVPTHLIGSDAFQECDTTGITRSCTKHNYLVRKVDDLPRILHEAFYIASSGRPGPVVVDIPKDVQFASGVYSSRRTFSTRPTSRASRATSSEWPAVEMMAAAKKPVFYTGGGVINSGLHASTLLRELVHSTGFPITSTLMGLGPIPPPTGNGWACSACMVRSRPTTPCMTAI